MFYQYNQNNSGGSFIVDDQLCHRLIIEADSEKEANDKAQDIGVYFNGCDMGMDCECCGDRWYSPNLLIFPYSYTSFNEEDAKIISEEYEAEMELIPPRNELDKRKYYGIIFQTPESYSQYVADCFGWTSPDTRIFYKGGTVVEISGKIRQRNGTVKL